MSYPDRHQFHLPDKLIFRMYEFMHKVGGIIPLDQSWLKVKHFHEFFSIPVGDGPQRLSEERVQKRATWMEEEVQEFRQAQTLTEQVDAMIDILYFALGTLVEMGVKPESIFNIVHEANMSKCFPDGKPRYRPSDGKVIKPPTWQDPAPKIEAELKRQIQQAFLRSGKVPK